MSVQILPDLLIWVRLTLVVDCIDRSYELRGTRELILKKLLSGGLLADFSKLLLEVSHTGTLLWGNGLALIFLHGKLHGLPKALKLDRKLLVDGFGHGGVS